ncbi:hypothetical protein R6Q57_022657 [Mikania cordata]
MRMLLSLIWITLHLSLVFMMAMEVKLSLSSVPNFSTNKCSSMKLILLVILALLSRNLFSGKLKERRLRLLRHAWRWQTTTLVIMQKLSYGRKGVVESRDRPKLIMDEMMCGQRGWRELAILGNKMDQFSGMIEGLIWSPRSGSAEAMEDNWSSEEGPHSKYDGPACGSTACVAIIRNNQLVVANAGDSRCVISRKGQASDLSKDHKPDLQVEKERIYNAGGYIQYGRVNGSLNLARAIGDMELKRNRALPPEKQILTANPDINIVELCEDDDFLVLACDGIWDCMSSQQLVDFIHEQLKIESKLSAVCERVFDRCLAPISGGEGCDNMTMILVQFNKSKFGPSTSQLSDSSNDQEVPRSN